MYASVRTYRSDPAKMEEQLQLIDEEFAPKLQREPGFCAYQVIDCGDGSLVTISCFRDRDAVERSVELAAAFVRERLADFDLERTDAKAGDIRISLAAEEVLEPAHV
jgi:quinol monooxygenase YgiN